MKSKSSVILVFLVVFLSFTTVHAQTEKKSFTFISPKRERQFNPDFVGKPEQKLEEAEHKLSDAFASYDVKALTELISDDLEVMGVTSGNAKKFIVMLVSESQKFANEYRVTSVEKSDLRIRIVNDIGIVTGRLVIDYKKQNGGGMSTSTFMHVWSKDGSGKWRCIAMSTDGQKFIHYAVI